MGASIGGHGGKYKSEENYQPSLRPKQGLNKSRGMKELDGCGVDTKLPWV